MAGTETQGLKSMHKPVSDKENECPEDDRNENAVKESLTAKHQRITDMFLARPAAQNIKIAIETSLDDGGHAAEMVCKESHRLKNVHKPVSNNEMKCSDDSNENAVVAVVESLKAKHQRIAEMFLARPAAQNTNTAASKDVKMIKKKKKKKEKRKKKKNEDKKVIKAEQSQNTANMRKEREQVPDDIVTEIEAADDINKTWKILGCFDFIRSWYSKKKQQRQQKNEQNRLKRQEKRERKGSKGLSYTVAVDEIHEPPSICENEGNLDACDADFVDINLF